MIALLQISCIVIVKELRKSASVWRSYVYTV